MALQINCLMDMRVDLESNSRLTHQGFKLRFSLNRSLIFPDDGPQLLAQNVGKLKMIAIIPETFQTGSNLFW